jgi:CheY-like chemotaxis protein
MTRILIVDDDPQTLDVLDFCLTLEGHDVLRAVNGEEALATARAENPELIVLDSMMPVMDGITAARQLREDPDTATIPIVMLTARATDTDIWEGYQSGVASYVTKPLDLDVLQAELERFSNGALVGTP